MTNRKLVAPTKRDIVLRPVKANAGIEAEYRRRLQQLVDQMHKSLMCWLSAAYRANTPHAAMAADDATPMRPRGGSPANAMRQAMHRLSRRWLKAFNDGAPALAKYFADKSMGASDIQLKTILRKAGFSVEFKMTPAANDGYRAVIGENVGLIKSIASEHLAQVEGLVMRSVQHGRDLKWLTDELEKRYKITRKRAAFIARDQNNKATAVITKIRQKGLGITQARWQHSSAGKQPRPSHVAANGKTYDIEKGMLIDGKYIFPGELPNCRCTSQSIIPGFTE